MTSSTTNPQRPYHRPRPLSAFQTLLWLVAGIAGMFALVSTIFAIKLGLEGRLPFSETPPPAARAPAPEAPTPPVTAGNAPVIRSAQAASPGAAFVSGAEAILPAEVAHLARNASALDTPPAGPGAPPTPPIPAAATPAPAAPQAAPGPAPATTTPAVATPATPAAPSADDAVRRTLQAWASAWSAKDVDAYLAHYASTFTPAGDLDRNAWAAQRRQRIARPGDIVVKLDAIDLRIDGDKASARFIQHYRSGAIRLDEPKTLELARSGSTWQITQERIGH